MSVEDILKRSLLTCTGATKDATRIELLATMRDLCKRTGIWRDKLVVPLADGVSTYTLTPPDESEISIIDRLYYGEYPLRPASDYGRNVTQTRDSYSFSEATNEVTLHMDDIALADGPLNAFVWLRPTAVTGAPEWLTSRYLETLSAGVNAAMMLHPERPYTNPSLSLLQRRIYLSGVSEAKRLAMSSNSRADVGWRFPHATRSVSPRR